MSEAGYLYVAVRPDTRGFSSALDRDIAQMNPGTQALLKRTGLDKTLKGYDKASRDLIATQNVLSAAEAATAAQTAKLAKAHDQVAIHAHRSQIAGFTVRGTTLGLGAAAVIGAEGLRKLSEGLKVVGEEADTTTGRLKNAAAAALTGDFATAAQNLGRQAAFDINPGARVAAGEATAAAARDTARQDAIALAQKILDLREKTAKVEGQVGTAAGVTRFELEKQLKLSQAQYRALSPELQRIAAGQFNLRPDLGNKVAVAPTDTSRASSFGLDTLRRERTKTLADDRALFEDRQKFLKGQIGYLESAGAHTEAAKSRLATLYGQLDSVDGQIQALDEAAQQKRQERLQTRIALAQTDLDIEAANARSEGQEVQALRDQASFARKTAENKNLDLQTRRGFELQAAQADKQIYDIGVAAAERSRNAAEQAAAEAKRRREEAARLAKEEIDRRRQEYRDDISLTEQKLGISLQRAQLTDKNLADDRAAIKRQIAYYRTLANDHKLTDSERLNFRSQQLSAQQSLKTLGKSNEAPRASAADFFKQAASEFRTFGSNITSRGGPLSGQDARAQFAARALSGSSAQGIAMVIARTQAQRDQAALSELTKSNGYLKTIADRLTYGGAKRDPPAKGIANARRVSKVVGG